MQDKNPGIPSLKCLYSPFLHFEYKRKMKKGGEMGSQLIRTLQSECISCKKKGNPIFWWYFCKEVVTGTFTPDQKSDLSRNHAILKDGHEVNQQRDHAQLINTFAEGLIHPGTLIAAVY